MNAELFKAYTAARDHGAWHGPLSASQALKVARYELRMKAARYPRWPGDEVEVELPRGERIVMKLEHDSDADACERNGVEVEHVRGYACDDIFANAPDWWQDREHNVYFREDRDRFVMTPDDGMVGGYERLGRHRAFLANRAQVDSMAQTLREAYRDGYVGCVVTLYDANGREVDAESVWGFEATGDYAGRECLEMAEAMAKARARQVAKDDAAMRDLAKETRAEFRALADEVRRIGALLDTAPAVCEAIRSTLRDLRAKHSTCARALGGAA